MYIKIEIFRTIQSREHTDNRDEHAKRRWSHDCA